MPPPVDPENPFKGKAGIARMVAATSNSCAGLRAAWRNERSFRLEVLAAMVMMPIALWAPVSPVERALLGASVLLVLLVELLNSGLEAAIDRIGAERHPLSGRAKDLGSAAVFVSLLLCAFVWAAILLPLWRGR